MLILCAQGGSEMPIGGQLCNPARITRIARWSWWSWWIYCFELYDDDEDDDDDMKTDRCPWQHFSPQLLTRNSKVHPDHMMMKMIFQFHQMMNLTFVIVIIRILKTMTNVWNEIKNTKISWFVNVNTNKYEHCRKYQLILTNTGDHQSKYCTHPRGEKTNNLHHCQNWPIMHLDVKISLVCLVSFNHTKLFMFNWYTKPKTQLVFDRFLFINFSSFQSINTIKNTKSSCIQCKLYFFHLQLLNS